MNHCIFSMPGVTALLYISGSDTYIARFIILGAFPFLLLLARCYTSAFLPFAAFHGLITAAAVYLMLLFMRGDLPAVIIFSVYIAGYIIASIAIRVKISSRMEKPIHPIIAVVIPILMMWFLRSQSRVQIDSYFIIALISYFGVYSICYYLEHFRQFIKINSDISGVVPERAMFRTGIKLVSLFTAAGVMLLILVSRIDMLPDLLAWMLSGLRFIISLIARLFRLFARERSDEVVSELPPADFGWPAVDLDDTEGGTQAPWAYLIIMGILFACALVFGLRAVITLLRERFGGMFDRQAGVEGSDIDVREKVDVIRNKRKRRELVIFLSPRERIRRIYKKRVLKGKDRLADGGEKRPLNFLTARECGQILDVPVLAEIYEKARYSPAECTPEDVKAARRR